MNESLSFAPSPDNTRRQITYFFFFYTPFICSRYQRQILKE
jgi:hypothetical protein